MNRSSRIQTPATMFAFLVTKGLINVMLGLWITWPLLTCLSVEGATEEHKGTIQCM